MVKEKVSNENPYDKFRRLATKRTNKILDNLRILGNCSNQSVYNYNQEDVKKIFSTIEREVDRVKKLFEKEHRKNKKFEL